MSKIFIPYLVQDHINHKYFVYTKKNNDIEKYWTLWSGLYPKNNTESEWIYSIIFDLLLLYDEVIVTLEDFYYLLNKIDHSFMFELLDSNSMKIIDTNSFKFSYHIKKENLVFLTDSGNKGIGYSTIKESLPDKIINMIQKSLIQIDNNDEFINKIISESNSDLRDSKITKQLDISSSSRELETGNYNFKINRIFYMNYFYAIQAKLGINYLYQDQLIYDLLKVKSNSHLSPSINTVKDGLDEIVRLENLLNINKLVLDKRISLNDLLKLRNHKDTVKFRNWITNINPENISSGYDYAKEYHQACLKINDIEKIASSGIYKGINTALSIGLGVVPIIGGIYAGFDNFKDYIIKGWKPNSFINNIRNTIDK